MPNTTIAIDKTVRDRLKTFGHAGMTYTQILQRMMDEIEREAFIRDIRRQIAETKDEDWIDLEDLDEDFKPKAEPSKPKRAQRAPTRTQARHARSSARPRT